MGFTSPGFGGVVVGRFIARGMPFEVLGFMLLFIKDVWVGWWGVYCVGDVTIGVLL
jgi:hypothetical protein